GRGSPDPPARPTAGRGRTTQVTIRRPSKRVWRSAPLTRAPDRHPSGQRLGRSECKLAAVHHDSLTGNKGCVVGGEKGEHRRYLLGTANPAQRDLEARILLEVETIRIGALGKRGADEAGPHRVDADA